MQSQNVKKFNQGIALVEIIVAISIITMALLAILTVIQKSIYISRQSLQQAQASFLLEEGVEAVKVVRDNDWSLISSLLPNTNYYLEFNSNLPNLTTTQNSLDIFTRIITTEYVYRDNNDDIAVSGVLDEGTRYITITISWLNGGQVLTKSLSFYLANIFQ